MTTPSSPLLQDSLVAFARATHDAFVSVDADVRKAVALAKSEAREARRERDEARHERDEATDARHAFSLEMQILKQEVTEYKAALKQADATIAHQEDTIVQARREATQWKDQSRNWQEHFLRVEQERCKLTTRVEELVSERLALSNQGYFATFTPRRTYVDMLDPAPSTSSTKRASSSSNAHKSRRDSSPTSKSSSDMALHPVDRSQKLMSTLKSPSPKNLVRRQHPPSDHQLSASRSQVQPHRQPVAQPPSQPPLSASRTSAPEVRTEPRQVFIRRVQAVVQIPVKDEDIEEDLLDSSEISISASASGSGSGSVSVPPRHQADARRVHPKTVNGRSIVQSDEESVLDDDYDEIEEVDPNHAAFSMSDHSDEDELIMGPEGSRREVYGTEPTESRTHPATTAKSTRKTGQKRKLTGPTRTRNPKRSRI